MHSQRSLQQPRKSPFPRTVWGLTWKITVVLWLGTSLIFVDETEDVIIERLGKIAAVYDKASPQGNDRGLHFKFPWPLDIARRFDRRTQIFEPLAREMFTRDRKNLTVGSYLCWRIAETPLEKEGRLVDRPVVRFYRSLGDVKSAEQRLDSRLRSILSAEIGRRELSDLLLSEDSVSPPATPEPLRQLSQKILELVRRREHETLDLDDRDGIEIVDAGIRRLNLPEGNLFSVYERMRKEREKIAQYYRSVGEAEKTVIESRARRQSEELLARAEADARRIKGQGEATALGIRNAAYLKDPEFFQFLRTLDAYRKILSNRTSLILSTSSPLFKLLTEGIVNAPQGPSREPMIPTKPPKEESLPVTPDGKEAP